MLCETLEVQSSTAVKPTVHPIFIAQVIKFHPHLKSNLYSIMVASGGWRGM